MSKKDFDEYYASLCAQHAQLAQELEIFQQMASEQVIEPERLENLKKTFQPVLDSYQMISWVAFLLNKPAKKKKRAAYNKMTAKRMSQLDQKFSKEGLVSRNNSVLEQVRTVTRQQK